MKRDENLHKTCETLRENPAFARSIADQYEQTSYMSDDDVIAELKRQAEQLRSIRHLRKNECGALTTNEKKLLVDLEQMGY